MTDDIIYEKSTNSEEESKKPVTILGRTLSDGATEIFNNIKSLLTKPIFFKESTAETSRTFLSEEMTYIVEMKSDTSDFEKILLHECSHLLQIEEKYPRILNVAKNWDGEDEELLLLLENLVLDKQINQELGKSGFDTKNNTKKYDTLYPLLFKNLQVDFPETLNKRIAIEIVNVFQYDSNKHGAKMMKVCSSTIQQYAQKLLDIFSNYSSGINKDNCAAIYSELIGALNLSKTEN